jgi:hypothetical protein
MLRSVAFVDPVEIDQLVIGPFRAAPWRLKLSPGKTVMAAGIERLAGS